MGRPYCRERRLRTDERALSDESDGCQDVAFPLPTVEVFWRGVCVCVFLSVYASAVAQTSIQAELRVSLWLTLLKNIQTECIIICSAKSVISLASVLSSEQIYFGR